MNKLEEIKKHIMLINDILLKEETKEEKPESKRLRIVYWLDEVWVLDRETIKVFSEWASAYEYYRSLAKNVLEWYKQNCERNKWVCAISDFDETTYFNNRDYPEFWIDNVRDWQCRTFFDYEEVFLEEVFIS